MIFLLDAILANHFVLKVPEFTLENSAVALLGLCFPLFRLSSALTEESNIFSQMEVAMKFSLPWWEMAFVRMRLIISTAPMTEGTAACI